MPQTKLSEYFAALSAVCDEAEEGDIRAEEGDIKAKEAEKRTWQRGRQEIPTALSTS